MYENMSRQDCYLRDKNENSTKTSNDAFYLRPFEIPRDDGVWFSTQPMGRYSLSRVVADICREAGLPGHRTSHSLRGSTATRLYDAGVDEQLICEITGHRSISVCNYKRTSEGQKKIISNVIHGDNNPGTSNANSKNNVTKTYMSEMENSTNKPISITPNIDCK